MIFGTSSRKTTGLQPGRYSPGFEPHAVCWPNVRKLDICTDLASESLRFWPVYSYLIIYRPNSEPIEVVRVLHGARDISAIM